MIPLIPYSHYYWVGVHLNDSSYDMAKGQGMGHGSAINCRLLKTLSLKFRVLSYETPHALP